MSLIVIAQNVTGDGQLNRPDGTSDYQVEVSVNRERLVWIGKVERHVREEGAAALLKRIAAQMEIDEVREEEQRGAHVKVPKARKVRRK
jgi:hypothetical protein